MSGRNGGLRNDTAEMMLFTRVWACLCLLKTNNNVKKNVVRFCWSLQKWSLTSRIEAQSELWSSASLGYHLYRTITSIKATQPKTWSKHNKNPINMNETTANTTHRQKSYTHIINEQPRMSCLYFHFLYDTHRTNTHQNITIIISFNV